jgi:hypothetical protein
VYPCGVASLLDAPDGDQVVHRAESPIQFLQGISEQPDFNLFLRLPDQAVDRNVVLKFWAVAIRADTALSTYLLHGQREVMIDMGVDTGQCKLNGRDVASVPPKKRIRSGGVARLSRIPPR